MIASRNLPAQKQRLYKARGIRNAATRNIERGAMIG